MDTRWEIDRISTPERIFAKVKTEMAQPVGIVFFGAYCDFRNEVLDTMLKELGEFARYYTTVPDTPTLVRAIQNHSAVAVILNSEKSGLHGLRHELVKVMKNAGAATVVGIYAKATKAPLRRRLPFFLSPQTKFDKQLAAIEKSHPTADGLDYFIVVEEEKER